MADRYYAVPTIGGGGMQGSVVEGAGATGGAFADLRITYDAAGASKTEVIKALEAIKNYVVNDTWPPV